MGGTKRESGSRGYFRQSIAVSCWFFVAHSLSVFCVHFMSRTIYFSSRNLPRLLLISSSLLHAHQIRLRIISLHLAMLLEHFDQRFTNGLWHFPRRAADIHDAVLVRKRIIYLLTLLANKILHVNLLALQHPISLSPQFAKPKK
jgi:hypothetical protein